jgi:non-heme chloroperoxidase
VFFLEHGCRVIAHDRRGHGRSTQTGEGHDMDHYAADLRAVVEHLDLRDAIHVGHSTGGGEVAHYIAAYSEDRVARAVLISAVPPLMVQTESNPAACPRACSTTCMRNSRPAALTSTEHCRRVLLRGQPPWRRAV